MFLPSGFQSSGAILTSIKSFLENLNELMRRSLLLS